MLCILYVIAVGTCLGIAGLLVERALPASASRRWLWCGVIAISMTIPPLYQAHHTSSVTEVLEHHPMHAPAGQSFGSEMPGLAGPGWSERIESYAPVINRLWLIASAALIIWGLANAWRVSRIVTLARRSRANAGGPAVVDDVPVVVTDSVGPATVGLLRSRVLVPRWVLALPGAQRQYVLRHEDEHRRSHDALLLFVASLALIMVPWNLALWWQLRRLRLAVEMDCDNRVVAALGDATAYGGLLLRIAEATSRGPRLQPAFLGGMGSLERRLTALLAPAPLRHAQRFLVPAAAFVLLLIVLSMPHPILVPGPDTHSAGQHSATAAEVIVSR